MDFYRYIPLLLLAAAAATACTVEPVDPDTGRGNILKITASAPTTKSPVALGSDMIYAYPFGLEGELAGLNGIPVTANSIIGTEYTYYMPQTSQDVVFTNITDGLGPYSITAPADGDTLMKITMADGTPGSEADLVMGLLPKTDGTTDNTVIHQVHLSRKVAQVTLNFRVKQKNSEEFIQDLSQFFSRVSLSVPAMSTYCVSSINDNSGTYYGNITHNWNSTAIPQDSVLCLAREMFIFPSTPGTTPEFTLSLTTTSGNEQTLTSNMDTGFEANKHYNLTLTLRQRSDGMGFVVDSLIHEDMEIDMDYADIIVDPAMSLDMELQSESVSDTTYRDFILGTDTLWVYPFLTENGDSLADGYPKPQKAIINGRYTFSVPQGTQNLLFANTNMCRDSSDYWTSPNYSSKHFSDEVTFDNLYIMMNPDCKGIATSPLILGTSGEVNVVNSGVNLNIDLERRSTGVRFLMSLMEQDSTQAAISDYFQYFWLSICNDTYEAYRPYDHSFYGWINPGVSEFGPIDTQTLQPVEYNDSTLWQLTPYVHILSSDPNNKMATFYALTTSGDTDKEISFMFDAERNQLSTLVIELKTSEIY